MLLQPNENSIFYFLEKFNILKFGFTSFKIYGFFIEFFSVQLICKGLDWSASPAVGQIGISYGSALTAKQLSKQFYEGCDGAAHLTMIWTETWNQEK